MHACMLHRLHRGAEHVTRGRKVLKLSEITGPTEDRTIQHRLTGTYALCG